MEFITCTIIGVIVGCFITRCYYVNNKVKGSTNNEKEEVTYIGNTPMWITKNGHTYPHPDNPNYEPLKPDFKSSHID